MSSPNSLLLAILAPVGFLAKKIGLGSHGPEMGDIGSKFTRLLYFSVPFPKEDVGLCLILADSQG